MSAEECIEELGLELPSPPEPIASYVTFARTGNVVYLADNPRAVGTDIGVEEAAEAARITGLGLIATLRNHLGSLDQVGRVIKLLGVVNGCSDLLAEVFGDIGRHARSAVGVTSLPMGIPVEIEAIVETR